MSIKILRYTGSYNLSRNITWSAEIRKLKCHFVFWVRLPLCKKTSPIGLDSSFTDFENDIFVERPDPIRIILGRKPLNLYTCLRNYQYTTDISDGYFVMEWRSYLGSCLWHLEPNLQFQKRFCFWKNRFSGFPS